MTPPSRADISSTKKYKVEDELFPETMTRTRNDSRSLNVRTEDIFGRSNNNSNKNQPQIQL